MVLPNEIHRDVLRAKEALDLIRQQVQIGTYWTVAALKLPTFNSIQKGLKLSASWG